MTLVAEIFSRAAPEHAVYIIAFLLLLYIYHLYFHNGLNRYPGPLLAKFTDLWRLLDVWGRQPHETHIALHRKHGDVVRIGPNTLSFSSPAAAKVIYGLNNGFTKVSFEPQSFTHTF
jgi:hypothetical protein